VGAVLFFLQKTKKQMGHFCMEEVLQVLLGDQIVDGQVVGAYRRYAVDLDSAISRFDEAEFLLRLVQLPEPGSNPGRSAPAATDSETPCANPLIRATPLCWKSRAWTIC
jgi:hypothetical protein